MFSIWRAPYPHGYYANMKRACFLVMTVMECHPRSLIRSATPSRVPFLDLLATDFVAVLYAKAVKDLFNGMDDTLIFVIPVQLRSRESGLQTLQLRKCGWHAPSATRIFARLMPVVPLHIRLNLAIFWDYHQVPVRHFDRKRNLRAAPIRMDRSKMCVEGHFGK